MLVIAVTTIAALSINAATVRAPSVGKRWAVAVPAASTRPPTALPKENPTLRTTWLTLMALDVSLFGVTARITAGIAAEKLPTPKPRIAIHARSPARFERATRDSEIEAGALLKCRVLMRMPITGTIESQRCRMPEYPIEEFLAQSWLPKSFT